MMLLLGHFLLADLKWMVCCHQFRILSGQKYVCAGHSDGKTIHAKYYSGYLKSVFCIGYRSLVMVVM